MKTTSQFGNLAAQNRTPVRLADWSICTRSERTNKRNEHRHNGVPVNIIYFRYSFPSNESIKIIFFSLLFRSRQHPSDFVAAFLFFVIDCSVCFGLFFHIECRTTLFPHCSTFLSREKITIIAISNSHYQFVPCV